jgi:GH15 family glucan-1,4-alpha-glucosidase
MTGAIAQDRESCQSVFCLTKNPLLYRSPRRESGRKVRERSLIASLVPPGFDRERNAFMQFYGSKKLDASLLMIPLVGFLPADDARVRGTVAAIERELMREGFVARYHPDEAVDGLPPAEGVFLPCTFWLADNFTLGGRQEEAKQVFERLLAVCNDVGLLSEEYDTSNHRLLGNFPKLSRMSH